MCAFDDQADVAEDNQICELIPANSKSHAVSHTAYSVSQCNSCHLADGVCCEGVKIIVLAV